MNKFLLGIFLEIISFKLLSMELPVIESENSQVISICDTNYSEWNIEKVNKNGEQIVAIKAKKIMPRPCEIKIDEESERAIYEIKKEMFDGGGLESGNKESSYSYSESYDIAPNNEDSKDTKSVDLSWHGSYDEEIRKLGTEKPGDPIFGSENNSLKEEYFVESNDDEDPIDGEGDNGSGDDELDLPSDDFDVEEFNVTGNIANNLPRSDSKSSSLGEIPVEENSSDVELLGSGSKSSNEEPRSGASSKGDNNSSVDLPPYCGDNKNSEKNQPCEQASSNHYGEVERYSWDSGNSDLSGHSILYEDLLRMFLREVDERDRSYWERMLNLIASKYLTINSESFTYTDVTYEDPKKNQIILNLFSDEREKEIKREKKIKKIEKIKEIYGEKFLGLKPRRHSDGYRRKSNEIHINECELQWRKNSIIYAFNKTNKIMLKFIDRHEVDFIIFDD